MKIIKNKVHAPPLSFAERWHYVLNWPLMGRCALAVLMYSILELFYLTWKLYILAFHENLELVNTSFIRQHVPFSTLLFLVTLSLSGLCYTVRHQHRFESWLPYICTFFITISMCYHGYLVGMMTPATGLIMTGLPMIGILLIGPKFVYPPLIMGMITASLITYLSIRQIIPYAPIFKENRHSVFWAANIGFFCIPLLAGLILLFDFIIRQWRKSEAENKRLVQTDPLTGLYNRRSLNQHLHEISKLSEVFSIALLDIDFFKKINDNCGHLVGDRILQDVAELMRKNSRSSDWIGRFGGEEFIMIMPHTDGQAAYLLCERHREAITHLSVQTTQGEQWQVTGSFGVVTTKGPFNVSHTLSVVDEMLYQAKQRGRNRVVSAQAQCPSSHHTS